MVGEFGESQIQFVQLLLDMELRSPGVIPKVLDTYERIKNILDYNMSVFSMLVGHVHIRVTRRRTRRKS